MTAGMESPKPAGAAAGFDWRLGTILHIAWTELAPRWISVRMLRA